MNSESNPNRIQFRLQKGQIALAIIILLNLSVLSISTFSTSSGAAREREVFTSAESAASSIVFTLRESLSYTTKYSLWLAGIKTKREAIIARALLAQRLNVIDVENTDVGSRVDPEYLSALKRTDKILESAPDGILPREISRKLSIKSQSDLDIIVITSKAIVVEYQQVLNKNIGTVAEDRQERAENNLILLVTLMLLTSIFLIWVGRSFLITLRKIQLFVAKEVELLDKANKDLSISQGELQTLEELNESKNDFISTINHELRTPLTSIIGYTELLKDEVSSDSNPKVNKFMSVLNKNAEVLLDIVESILSLSELDANRKRSANEEIDLKKIIDKSIFVLIPQAESKGITFEFNANKDLDFNVIGNPNQLSQIFINLLSNAIKYSPNDSQVLVSIDRVVNEKMVSEIQVFISDKGIGIPEKDLPLLFTRFFRASNAINSHIAGTGLGLAIVAKLLEVHSARIRVESVFGEGSTFIINIPASLSPIELAMFKKRGPVLSRAIEAIEGSNENELYSVCHQMGGAIGMYGLDQLGNKITDFANWLRDNPAVEANAISEKKLLLLTNLQDVYQIIQDQEKT